MSHPSDAFVIDGLQAQVESTPILQGVSLTVQPGELHAIMGPNGSGKSTLASVLMGHPRYTVTGGTVTYRGTNVLDLTPDKRSALGLFLAFQYPVEVPGVKLIHFLRTAYNASKPSEPPLSAIDFYAYLKQRLSLLGIDESFVQRSLNEGFSGGEKKKCEVLQLAVLRPSFAILDETDSGLDIDALRTIAGNLRTLADEGMSMLVVTHYRRILDFLKPDVVHVLAHGRIAVTGGPELAEHLEREGYKQFTAAKGKYEIRNSKLEGNSNNRGKSKFEIRNSKKVRISKFEGNLHP